ncbi:hypothetical protein ACIQZG_18725 [Lysinibacillus sp. NPDC096418]|uniref:hypothetical protein n=1 Tax=Lysinibacillus sp. NPDC096418 TaxID=3364138 RepID=UPI00382708EC
MQPKGTNVFQYIVDNCDYYDLVVMEDCIPNIRENLLSKLQYIFQEKMSFVSNKYVEINDDYFIQYRSYGIYSLFLSGFVTTMMLPLPRWLVALLILLHIQSSLMMQLKGEE